MQKINVKKLRPDARLPVYGTEFSAGADLCACLDAPVTLQPGETKLISIGIAMEIPVGWAGYQLVDALNGISKIGQSVMVTASVGYRTIPNSIQAFTSANRLRSFSRIHRNIVQTIQAKNQYISAQLLVIEAAALFPLIQHE